MIKKYGLETRPPIPNFSESKGEEMQVITSNY